MAEALMVSMSDLAARKGVSVQAIDKRVKALERAGQLTTEKRGRKRMVDMAAYDRAVDQVGDGIREDAFQRVKDTGRHSALRESQAELSTYKARMAQLDLLERAGKIVPIDGHAGLESAIMRVGTEMAQEIDSLVNNDGRLAKAAASGGAIAVRKELQAIAIELRNTLSNKLSEMAEIGANEERNAEASVDGFLLTEIDLQQ